MSTVATATHEDLLAADRRYRVASEGERRERQRKDDFDHDRYSAVMDAEKAAADELTNLLRAAGLRGVVCDGLQFIDVSADVMRGSLEPELDPSDPALAVLMASVAAIR